MITKTQWTRRQLHSIGKTWRAFYSGT